MEPGNPPKENTSPVLKLFVYGTLKRGYWNHDTFCLGVLEIREAQVRGRLYEGPGFPILEVPEKDILAYGTANHLADVATQAGLSDWVGQHPRPLPERPTAGAWGAVSGGAAHLRRPPRNPTRPRPAGGLPPGRFQPLPARAGTRHGGRCPRARLGLLGRNDRHQAALDRVGLLAGVGPSLSSITGLPALLVCFSSATREDISSLTSRGDFHILLWSYVVFLERRSVEDGY